MNEKKLQNVITKYKKNYYHDTSIYEIQYKEEKKEFASCDHIEIVYDLLECNIKESDIDFVWNNDIHYDENIFLFRKYIRKLELIDNNIKKSLIHLGWLFQKEEESWINYFIKKEKFNKLYIRYGQTLVETYIRSYKADQYFRRTCDMYDGMMKAISDDCKKDNKK